MGERCSDERVEDVVVWGRVEAARGLAVTWQQFYGAGASWLPKAFSWATIGFARLPDGIFGQVTGLLDEDRWQIVIDDRLPVAVAAATLGHEVGHLYQKESLGRAYCQPSVGLPAVEQEAHVLGAILTVPFTAVGSLALGDEWGVRRVAAEIALPASYVELRRGLAVFLGELPGDRRDASAQINLAMLHHARWQRRICDFLLAQTLLPQATA